MNLTKLDLIIIALPAVVVFVVALVMRRYLRSVADFLAAGRCAGRYLICTASAEIGAGISGLVVGLEVFSKTGFSLDLWIGFSGLVYFMLTLLGFVTFRFRETRALTFHQFFEIRYSRGLRVFASFLNCASGLFTFGIIPGVSARFFVYFLGLPETIACGLIPLPTYAVVMAMFLALSMFFCLTGGQISVMVTDALEGIISGIFYLIVAFALLTVVSYHQMEHVFISGPPGQSFVDPFDIAGRKDFNGWYVVLGLLTTLYFWRGGAWNAGFAAAGKSAHESKMAGILGVWRAMGAGAMGFLVSAGALTLLHHPDFADKARLVEQHLASIGQTQLRTQMRMPVALGLLLPAGAKGAFCAVALFGTLAGMGASMHGFGSTFIQDVVLPFRKRELGPHEHIRWLRWAVFGVGLFSLFFSIVYKPADYLVMAMSIISAIYLGGIGAVVLGGLYWKKATTPGAWAAMGVGSGLSVAFWGIQQFWTSLQPIFLRWAGTGPMADWIAQAPERCPINGQILATIAMASAGLSFIVVSLLTCQEDFDMDRMLHRGKYALDQDGAVSTPIKHRRNLATLIGIDECYTRSDKIMHWSIFSYSMLLNLVAVVFVVWNVFYQRWPAHWWWLYSSIRGLYLALALGIITTIWFTFGAIRDLIRLFRTLPTLQRNDADDGRVRNHHNLGDPEPPENNKSA